MLMLLLCNVFTLSAAEELYAQHYNVTLSLRNATVKEAVDAVTRQTGIAFSYESSVGVMPLGNVEIRVDGGAVDAVLGPLFADKGIAWQVVDGVVILTRQNSGMCFQSTFQTSRIPMYPSRHSDDNNGHGFLS